MGTIWFWLVAIMIAVYVLLDGFDLGAGAIHLFVARTDEERRQVLASIGPVWDGNEVWLIAAGGTLYFAFPALYASAKFHNLAAWIHFSAACGGRHRGRHLRIAKGRRTQSVPCVLRLSDRHVDERRFWRIPDGFAGAESDVLAHGGDGKSRGLRFEDRVGLVDHRDYSGGGILHLRVSLFCGQSSGWQRFARLRRLKH
jgi:Cytochrome bd terminal oxidase subunit II